MGKVIGIDLGTTNSCLAWVENKVPVVINNEEGARTTPSVVHYGKEKLVGVLAKRQATINPMTTIFGIKRLIGRKFEDKEVQNIKDNFPYKVVADDKGNAAVEVGGEIKSPIQISADVLAKIKRDAEAYIGEEITEAVISVPAYFDSTCRECTVAAGKVAGLNVLRVVSEPTSAALCAGFDENKEQKIIVYDLGGGTFDVSILDMSSGVTEVLSTSGNSALGGEDFDNRLVDWVISEFKQSSGIDLRKDSSALQRVKDRCEECKKELSTTNQADINIPFITTNTAGPLHLDMKITRTKFESLVKDLVDQTLVSCREALKEANLKKEDLDAVLLVGGMTRMPLVQQTVEEFYEKKADKSVNPDEVVAQGAAILGSALAGESNDVLLLDVTPLSLNITSLGNIATTLIEKNTTIPCSKSETFSTAVDSQASVTIEITQGERKMAADNKVLARFDLHDIPPAPRGVPKILVKFDVSADGILTVSAKDEGTGREQSITIKDSGSLSKEEIDRMIREAEEHAEEDKIKRELVETKNQAEGSIFQIEKALKEHEDKVEEEEKADIEKHIEELKELLTKEDKDAIVKGIEKLNESFHKVSGKIYAQEAPQGPPEGFTAENGPQDAEAQEAYAKAAESMANGEGPQEEQK